MTLRVSRDSVATRVGTPCPCLIHVTPLGLPIRQWRHDWLNIVPPPPPETTRKADRFSNECPFGMPKDWTMLPSHNQELLRATRCGGAKQSPALDDDDGEALDEDKKEKEKKDKRSDDGVLVKVWQQIPRNIELPSASHLAKRRQNTVTLPTKAAIADATVSTATRAVVRRVDAAGNTYEQTVMLGEGETITDGEIVATTSAPVVVVGDLNGEAVAQAAPVRRRPLPPKTRKKMKGPGRGRKKGRLPLPTSGTPGFTPAQQPLPSAPRNGDAPGHQGLTNSKDLSNQDTNMADASLAATANDDSEGSEDDEDGEEDGEGEGEGDGEVDGDGEGELEEVDTTLDADIVVKREESPQDQMHAHDSGNETTDSELTEFALQFSTENAFGGTSSRELSPLSRNGLPPVNQVHLALANGAGRLRDGNHEGSPLRNVMINSPMEPSPLRSGALALGPGMTSHTSTMDIDVPNFPGTEESHGQQSWPAESTEEGKPDAPSAAAAAVIEPPSATKECEDDKDGFDLLGGLERELDRQAAATLQEILPSAANAEATSPANLTDPPMLGWLAGIESPGLDESL